MPTFLKYALAISLVIGTHLTVYCNGVRDGYRRGLEDSKTVVVGLSRPEQPVTTHKDTPPHHKTYNYGVPAHGSQPKARVPKVTSFDRFLVPISYRVQYTRDWKTGEMIAYRQSDCFSPSRIDKNGPGGDYNSDCFFTTNSAGLRELGLDPAHETEYLR